jgi:hypothetical protein
MSDGSRVRALNASALIRAGKKEGERKQHDYGDDPCVELVPPFSRCWIVVSNCGRYASSAIHLPTLDNLL